MDVPTSGVDEKGGGWGKPSPVGPAVKAQGTVNINSGTMRRGIWFCLKGNFLIWVVSWLAHVLDESYLGDFRGGKATTGA